MPASLFWMVPLVIIWTYGFEKILHTPSAAGAQHTATPQGHVSPLSSGIILLSCLLIGLLSLSAVTGLAPEKGIIKIIYLCVVFICLKSARGLKGQKPIMRSFFYGVGVGCLFLIFESTTGLLIQRFINSVMNNHPIAYSIPLVKLNQGVAVLTILLWPLGAFLWHSVPRFIAVILIGGIGLYIILMPNQSATLALLAGGGIAMIGLISLRCAHVLCGIIWVCGFMLSPVIGPLLTYLQWDRVPWLMFSARHRIEVWNFVTHKWLEKIWFGWGVKSSAVLPTEQVSDFVASTDGMVPSHPHNAYLEILLETGLMGAGILCLLGGILIFNIKRVRGPLLPTLAVCLTIVATSYGIWQAWWQAAFLLVCCVCTLWYKNYSDRYTS